MYISMKTIKCSSMHIIAHDQFICITLISEQEIG